MKILAVFLFAAAMSAQTVKPVLPVAKAVYPEYSPWAWTGTTGLLAGPRYATIAEKITSDGHYVFTLDDPNNEYRCYGTINTGTITITCVEPHEVAKESK